MRLRSYFTLRERVAIGELTELAGMCADAAKQCEAKGDVERKAYNEALGAIILERCANIIRKEASPLVMASPDIVEFAKFWNVAERAAFNPPEEPK